MQGLGFSVWRTPVVKFPRIPQNVCIYFVKQAVFENQKDMASDDFE